MKEKNVASLIDKNPNEKIHYIIHRHPITFLKFIGFFLILAAVPLALYFLLNNLFPELITKEEIFATMVIMGSIYYLSILLFLYTKFVDFYLDVWIVTSQKVVDILQKQLFSRNISELDLDRIQDVTTDISGLFPTIFNYGNITIKTASNTTSIIFRSVPDPEKIRKDLIKFSDLNKRKNKDKQL